MSSYTVTDPSSGKKVTITGDAPPTEQDLDQIFSAVHTQSQTQNINPDVPLVQGMQGYDQQQAAQKKQYADYSAANPEPTTFDKLSAGGKALGVMAGNIIPATIGALGGSIYGAISGQGEDELVRGAQQFSPFSTTDPLANKYMQTAGNVLGSLDPAMAAGIPRASAMSKPTTQGVKNIAPAVADIIKEDIQTAKNVVSSVVPSNIEMVQKIKSGSTENSLAKFKLEVSNPTLKDASGNLLPQAYKVVEDPIAKQALGQEWEEGTVQAVKNFDPKSAQIAKRMLDVAEQGTRDDTFKASNRPISELGGEIARQVDYIRKVNRDAGTAIDEAAKNLKNERVDVNPIVDNFISSVRDDLGVSIKPSKNGVSIDFRGSNLEGDSAELRSAQGVLKNLVNRMYNTRNPSAYDVHRLKGYIDTQASYGSQLGGLKGKTDRIVKTLRHDLDSLLDDNFPEYNQANTVYAETKTAIDSMQELVGKKVDLRKDSASQSLGKLTRRILSNAQSAERVREAALAINEVATNYGAPSSGNIPALVKFADTLDKQFQIAADTSLAAEVAKGVTQSKTGAAINVGAAAYQKLRRVNATNKHRTMSELLKQRQEKTQ